MNMIDILYALLIMMIVSKQEASMSRQDMHIIDALLANYNHRVRPRGLDRNGAGGKAALNSYWIHQK
jgi:hypothetical protein